MAYNPKTLGVAQGGTSRVAITNHNLVIGAGTSVPTLLPPSSTAGIALVSQGSSADPHYSTVGIKGGGTGSTSFNPYGPVIAGNGSYDPLTSISPPSTSGIPLVSQGDSSSPSFSTAVVEGGGTGITTTTAYGILAGGTTATGAFQNIGVGSSGQVLKSNGAGSLASWAYGASPVYFKAGFSANQTNATGDGTFLNPIVWNVTVINVGSGYNTGTGIFTAPYTGLYMFSVSIFYTGMLSTHTYLESSCYNTSTNEYGWSTFTNPWPGYNVTAGGRGAYQAAGAIYCNAGNLVRTTLKISGGTKVISIYGDTGRQSNWSGFYIGA